MAVFVWHTPHPFFLTLHCITGWDVLLFISRAPWDVTLKFACFGKASEWRNLMEDDNLEASIFPRWCLWLFGQSRGWVFYDFNDLLLFEHSYVLNKRGTVAVKRRFSSRLTVGASLRSSRTWRQHRTTVDQADGSLLLFSTAHTCQRLHVAHMYQRHHAVWVCVCTR